MDIKTKKRQTDKQTDHIRKQADQIESQIQIQADKYTDKDKQRLQQL